MIPAGAFWNMRKAFQILVCLLAAAALLCGCAEAGESAATATAAPVAQTDPVVAPQTTPEPTDTPEPMPEIAPEGPVRSTGLDGEGCFTAEALFIGDSHTYRFVNYLREHGLFGEARCMAVCGMPLAAFDDAEQVRLADGFANGNASVCSPEFAGLSYAEALRKEGASSRAVYFLLGTNRSEESNEIRYLCVLREVLDDCPEATVWVHTVPYAIAADYIYANDSLHNAVSVLNFEYPGRVVLLDLCDAIPQWALSSDGIHYGDEAFAVWYALLASEANSESPA